MRIRQSPLAAVAGIVLAITLTPAQVHADTTTVVTDDGDVRVEVTVTEGVTVKPPKPMKAGERVATTNALGEEVIYEALSGSCTRSLTANTPYKGSYNGKAAATGTVSFSLSSGCSKIVYTAQMQWEDCAWWHGCDWKWRASDVDWIYPGTSVQIRLWKVCGNGDSDRWRTGGGYGQLPTISNSPASTLKCGF